MLIFVISLVLLTLVFFGIIIFLLIFRLQQLHASFSSTVRLAKRWMAAQLLSEYVCDEAVEIITAYLYLHPAPYTPPR